MKFETKVNLIFVAVVIVALSYPAYRLFLKKMDPRAPIMFIPPPVKRSVAYVAPLPAPASVGRVVPPRTAAWVGSLVRANSDAGRVETVGPADDPRPLVGKRWAFQVGSIVDRGDALDVGVILWDDRAYADPASYTFSADFDDATAASEKVSAAPSSVKSFTLPSAVRWELQTFGFIQPPVRVLWAAVTFPKPSPAARPTGFGVAYADAMSEFTDAVDVPADPAAAAEVSAQTPPVAETAATR